MSIALDKTMESVDGKDKEAIFKSLKFRNLEVKNRLFRSNMSGMFDDYNGHGGNARINWEEKFAKGGVGCIISSYVPVTHRGRILTNYAMIDDDDKIPFWKLVGQTVNQYDCKYILQLSHSGRQQDIGGVENLYRLSRSSTSNKDFFHGLLCQAMTRKEIHDTVKLFADGARRAREAGLDGVELHGANGYLITQFLSSGINDREDEYGGCIENRARFCLEIVRAIRKEVGNDFHLQMKINAVDFNNWMWPIRLGNKRGNTLKDTLEICRILEDDGFGVDAFHISSGSTFPHPRNPPGDISAQALKLYYDSMISESVYGNSNYRFFSNKLLGSIFERFWRFRRGPVIEGINAEFARQIKQLVNVPVICTGGFQHASVIGGLIRNGWCDAVSMARPLIANNDLPKIFSKYNGPASNKRCSYCNLCLVNDLANPLGCYDINRYDGSSFEEKYNAMIHEVMSVFEPSLTSRISELANRQKK